MDGDKKTWQVRFTCQAALTFLSQARRIASGFEAWLHNLTVFVATMQPQFYFILDLTRKCNKAKPKE
jgi:hypothetical protein